MSSNAKRKQYTVHNIPRSVDQALRKKANLQQLSLNTILLRALTKEAEIGTEVQVHNDLDALIGSWVSDPETELALKK